MILFYKVVLIGIGGSISMDIWSLFMKYAFGIMPLDYGLLGRWVLYLRDGVLFHENIVRVSQAKGEKVLGWGIHYAIGVCFAFLLVLFCGPGWVDSPKLAPALMVGIGTVAAPWFIMQPAFGFGVAASKAPAPWSARFKSIIVHVVYGLGLFGSALLFKHL